MPFHFQQRVETINEDLATTKPHLVVEMLEDAIKHLILDNADLFELQVDDLNQEMTNNSDLSRMQGLHLLRDLKGLEARLYELPVLAAKEKIERYQQQAQKIMNMSSEFKTMEELFRDDREAREKLILEMVETAKHKDDLSGSSLRNPQDAAKYRQKMVERLNGAEPWKQMRDRNDKFVSSFLIWARKNRRKDSPEAIKDYVEEQKQKGLVANRAAMNPFSQPGEDEYTDDPGVISSYGPPSQYAYTGIGAMNSFPQSSQDGYGYYGASTQPSQDGDSGIGAMNSFPQQSRTGCSAAMQQSMDDSLKRDREDGYDSEDMDSMLEPRKRRRVGEE